LAGIKTTFQVGAYAENEGMDPETISLVAGNPEKRSKLISNIFEISKKYEFDGVTFAWLFPGCPQVTTSFHC
jgi:GH18 family chitinase